MQWCLHARTWRRKRAQCGRAAAAGARSGCQAVFSGRFSERQREQAEEASFLGTRTRAPPAPVLGPLLQGALPSKHRVRGGGIGSARAAVQRRPSPVACAAAPGCSMERAAAPRATSATPRLPQPLRLLSRAAAPPRACVALASRLPRHGLRGALCSRARPREPPAALRHAFLPPLRAASRSGRSSRARATEVRTQPLFPRP